MLGPSLDHTLTTLERPPDRPRTTSPEPPKDHSSTLLKLLLEQQFIKYSAKQLMHKLFHLLKNFDP